MDNAIRLSKQWKLAFTLAMTYIPSDRLIKVNEDLYAMTVGLLTTTGGHFQDLGVHTQYLGTMHHKSGLTHNNLGP